MSKNLSKYLTNQSLCSNNIWVTIVLKCISCRFTKDLHVWGNSTFSGHHECVGSKLPSSVRHWHVGTRSAKSWLKFSIVDEIAGLRVVTIWWVSLCFISTITWSCDLLHISCTWKPSQAMTVQAAMVLSLKTYPVVCSTNDTNIYRMLQQTSECDGKRTQFCWC